MQRHEDQRIDKNCDHRPAISSSQFLVQVASVYDLLRAGLDHDTEQKDKEDCRSEFVKREFDIPIDTGHQYAETVHAESQQNACQYRFQVVAVSIVKERLPHGTVVLKERDHDHEYDPDAKKVKILHQEFHTARIAKKVQRKLPCRKHSVRKDRADNRSHKNHNYGQQSGDQKNICPAAACAKKRFVDCLRLRSLLYLRHLCFHCAILCRCCRRLWNCLLYRRCFRLRNCLLYRFCIRLHSIYIVFFRFHFILLYKLSNKGAIIGSVYSECLHFSL